MCRCGCEALNELPGQCDYVTYKRFGNNPQEHCDAETEPGNDYCQQHQGEQND